MSEDRAFANVLEMVANDVEDFVGIYSEDLARVGVVLREAARRLRSEEKEVRIDTEISIDNPNDIETTQIAEAMADAAPTGSEPKGESSYSNGGSDEENSGEVDRHASDSGDAGSSVGTRDGSGSSDVVTLSSCLRKHGESFVGPLRQDLFEAARRLRRTSEGGSERVKEMTDAQPLDDVADPVNASMYRRARKELLRRISALRDSKGREVVARGVVESVNPGGAIVGMLHLASAEVEVGQPFEVIAADTGRGDKDA